MDSGGKVMASPDTSEKNAIEKPDVRLVYGALLQLAIHGQENKWWMLYVFLMFNSILLLSCAALFAVQEFRTALRILLYLFSTVGTLIDVCWIIMAGDYVNASDLYADEVVEAEKLLPDHFPKPLTKRASQRAEKSPFGTSAFIAKAIPVLLIVMYAVIVVLACLRTSP
jgi:hypothetical protein